MELKTCFKCNHSLPRSEFYAHPKMADGLIGKCKPCARADVCANRAKRLDHYREAVRLHAKEPHIKAAAKANLKIYRAADARRRKAHYAVADAVKAGRLVAQPCIRCGDVKRSVAHHESYDRPLDVVWYCRVHHAERHKQMTQEGIKA